VFHPVLQIRGIELLQRLAQVSGAVYPDALSLYYHPGEVLAELDIHILRKGFLGQLWPSGYLGKIL
jgi:hypothetical protein